jgi:NAD-dependent SIR2 family protein deacetylase
VIVLLSQWLNESNYTVIFTDAGMSNESGLPDFRSSNGLWNKKDPSQIASVDSLNQNSDEFIEFYRERVLCVKDYKPHRGHEILAKWEKKGIIQSIITQNVDGFRQEAGSGEGQNYMVHFKSYIARTAEKNIVVRNMIIRIIIVNVVVSCAHPLYCSVKCCQKKLSNLLLGI